MAKSQDCIFCKIIKGELPSSIVAESNLSIAFNTNKPVAQHHVLIVPKKHIKSFLDLDFKDKDIFMDMIKLAQKIIKKCKIENNHKLALNGGKYQSVPHVHWHLLGGKLEDEDDVLNQT